MKKNFFWREKKTRILFFLHQFIFTLRFRASILKGAFEIVDITMHKESKTVWSISTILCSHGGHISYGLGCSSRRLFSSGLKRIFSWHINCLEMRAFMSFLRPKGSAQHTLLMHLRVGADIISRQVLKHWKWRLHPQVLELIWQRFNLSCSLVRLDVAKVASVCIFPDSVAFWEI